jgi:hypothetical protein
MKYTASQKMVTEIKAGIFFPGLANGRFCRIAHGDMRESKGLRQRQSLSAGARRLSQSRIRFAGCRINGVICFTCSLFIQSKMHRQENNRPLLQINAGEVSFRA